MWNKKQNKNCGTKMWNRYTEQNMWIKKYGTKMWNKKYRKNVSHICVCETLFVLHLCSTFFCSILFNPHFCSMNHLWVCDTWPDILQHWKNHKVNGHSFKLFQWQIKFSCVEIFLLSFLDLKFWGSSLRQCWNLGGISIYNQSKTWFAKLFSVLFFHDFPLFKITEILLLLHD